MLSSTKIRHSSEQPTSNMPRPLFKRNGSWDPIRDWPKSSLLDQCTGPPFFLEPGDISWVDTARKTLETSPWPGFLCFPLVTSVCPEISPSFGAGQQSQVSQVECDQKTWKISLDVSHFGAEEVSVKTKEGYLEITGKHEERQDEQGVISRSFTRKYKLPAEADLHQMSCTLSPEGILVVEAPLASSPIPFPAETEIPIQMLEKQ
ncbi:heat shock protein, alpha-crystallin-related, b15 [Astyanax mexicanus]|uniref:Heat shock protein, alpha-crystallin-related, b15 n=1 Tax=Astyanax mexicanus TaxID=7994 RepID=A0A3B1K0M6_ASTMX|nr:heat shock protein, alpha-crystallin-related, b15 [Astyanax mexicanus]